MENKTLITTMTGEPLQPVRIYYELLDRKTLLRKFNNFKCIALDAKRGRWVWEYRGEAAKLTFKQSRADLPREHRDIVLGSFYLKHERELVLDVKSFDRATKAIVFFDSYIPRTAARVTEMAVCNRLFGAVAEVPEDFEALFNRPDVDRIDPDALLDKVKQLDTATPGIEERRMALFSEMVEHVKRPLVELERFPVNYYEDGIEQLETSLKMRFMIAWEHFQGNTDFSFNDLLKRQLGTGLD